MQHDRIATDRTGRNRHDWIATDRTDRNHMTGSQPTLRDSMPRPRSVEDSVTDVLRDAILDGRLAPGRHLAQVELAEELGVSRIPLRDALRRLAAEGLVVIEGRRGAHVASLSPDDVAEIYELRSLLEAEYIRRAIERLDDSAVKKLIELAHEMDRLAADPPRGKQARTEFYAELYGHADRPRARAEILRLRSMVEPYHVLSGDDHRHDAHDELRECIARRDGEKAARVIREHLTEAGEHLAQSMRS